MKTINKIFVAVGVSSLAALPLMAGPVITVEVPAPVVTVQVPAPAPPPPAVIVTTVPDTYVWDGYEYVGVVGTQYYYLGAGNIWLPLDTVRVAHWHDWSNAHADWRDHAIHNELYRHDAAGHEVPYHDYHAPANVTPDNHPMGHDNSYDKLHDH